MAANGHRNADSQKCYPMTGQRMTIKFEPRDVWVGWFWDRRADGTHHYVCPIPCVVIHWVKPKRTVRTELHIDSEEVAQIGMDMLGTRVTDHATGDIGTIVNCHPPTLTVSFSGQHRVLSVF